MDLIKILTSGFALVFVLCLIGFVSVLLRRYGNSMNLSQGRKDARLKVKEMLNIDARKKIALIAKDDKEYLVAFNDNGIEILDKEDAEKNN